VVLFASGILTIGRELNSNGEYRLYGDDSIAAAAYVRENAPSDALVITGTQHTNAIAALSGRNIYVGAATFLYYHGLDYVGRQEQVKQIYEDPAGSLDLLNEIGADYILISSYERGDYGVAADAFEEWFPVAFRQGEVTLYAVSERARAAMAEGA
jgi:uncharacterized membrane protein